MPRTVADSPHGVAEDLENVLGSMQLPSFPALQARILQALRCDRTPLVRIAELLQADQGLSVKILSTVNCVGYGLQCRISSIQHAVSLLGVKHIENLTLAASVHDVLPRKRATGFVPGRFWRAAARRGAIAQALAELMHPPSQPFAFTAGLLQDMAIPFLVHAHGDTYGALLDRWHREGGDLIALERQAFGWDHSQVAGKLATQWNFPSDLSTSLQLHHGGFEQGKTAAPPVQFVSALGEAHNPRQDLEQVIHMAEISTDLPRKRVEQCVQDGLRRASRLSSLFR